MLVELLIGALVLLAVWDYLRKKGRDEALREAGITGPVPLPLVGNALLSIGNDTQNVFVLMKKHSARFGKIWRMWFFHESLLFIRDAKYFEAILSSQQLIRKNRLYDMLKSWLGEGLLISSGSKWHSRRKIITPTFHFKILEQFVEVFDQQSAVLVKRLYEKADGQTVVNLFPVVCLTALDIVAETAMGVQVNAQTAPDFPYVKAVTTVADIIATRFMKLAERFELGFQLTAPLAAWRLRKNIAVMHRFTNKVIQERREALRASIADGTYSPMSTDDYEIGSKKRMAFLDVLLQSTVSGKPLSNEDICEEVDTFMFEGHDTTTSGISHTLYLIARHPEVQRKLVEEIRAVIGDDRSRPVTMRDLQELKYLECVIKESLRLYPPVPMIGRWTEQDMAIKGHVIPANTSITLLIFAALRDPEYFSDPDAFKPERFGAASTEKIDPFAYVPFSAGPRNCIGQKFALLEMKSTISKVLRHFELLPLGEDVRPVMNLILRSSTGINVGLRPREH